MHFLTIKVVFSCLGHNRKFVRSSNAREILCLVSKILCVVRYKGGEGGDKGQGQCGEQCGGKGLVLRPPSGHSDSSRARRGKNRNTKNADK